MDLSNKEIEVFYSYRSPYSYLAIGQLYDWHKETGINIIIRPVYPLAIRTPDFFDKLNPIGHAYVLMDTKRTADFLDLDYKWPNPDPVNMTFSPLNIPKEQPYIHRLTRLGIESVLQGKSLEFTYAVSSLIFNANVDDWTKDNHLKLAISQSGLELANMDEAIDSDPKKYDDLIQKNQKDQNTSGHWGVPLMVYKGEPFFGQDRIAILKWRVEKSD